ncbi:hypothetical protein [Amycolatopsis sp. 195334CR]|uniref:hypothetical protein n=1 Tax=Amycolatopsis sp. 195334CR TaxID=2814588 RepID=UPI001A8CE045|nr:hypothetical protein [Amycolatopsis sp. 195334CR]MBN6042026.1 hypothetical protein [Amycolatopsis sp. 195334CR]
MTEGQQEANKVGEPGDVSYPVWERAAGESRTDDGGVARAESAAYAPISKERHLRRFEFLFRRPPVRAWVARVFVLSTGELRVFAPDEQPTTGELLWSGYRTMYDVDLSRRRLALELSVPSKGDAFAFRANVDLRWKVEEPRKVVAEGITDIRRLVVPLLLQVLRKATRDQQAASVQDAEDLANEELRVRKKQLGSEYGISAEVFVRLRMDEQWERGVRMKSEVATYRAIIARGDLDQFALHLAQRPGDVEDVLKTLVSERDSHRHDLFEFIAKLLKSGALERWQVDDKVNDALKWLQESADRVIYGTDDAHRFSVKSRKSESGVNGRKGRN